MSRSSSNSSSPPRPFLARGMAHARLVVFLGLVGVVVLGSYALQSRDAQSARISEEAGNLKALVSNLWSSSPDKHFGSLTVEQAVLAQQVPAAMLRATGVPVRSSWGTEIQLLPHGVLAPADGFVVRYMRLPPSACVELIPAVAPLAHDVKVQNRSVMSAVGVDMTDLRKYCVGHMLTVDFIFHPDLIRGTALPLED